MVLLAVIILFFILAMVPIALGLPWANTIQRENQFKVLACLPIRVGKEHENTSIDQYVTHIYAGLSEDLISTFHVMYNPWLTDDMKEVVHKSLRDTAGFEIPCSNSFNDGEIGEL